MFTQDDVKVIEGINQIPIFNIENVRGKCIAIPGGVQALVLADDIAREGGLTRENPITYVPKQNSDFLTTSGQKIHMPIFDNKLSKTYEYESIRWNRFNQYANDSIPYVQQYNPYWTNGGREFVIHILKKYKFIPNQDNGKKIVPLVIPINQL